MREDERLSRLIGDIYDAALDASLWRGVVANAAHFVGGAGAGLFARGAIGQSAEPYYDFGVAPHFKRLYFETYVKLDPLDGIYYFIDVGDVISNSDVIPRSEFVETRFFKEWAEPQGFVDNLVTLLEKSSARMAGFAVFRHERDGPTDDDARRRMRLIAPHLRRAVLIGRVIDLKGAEAASLADAFDGVSAGMFLVDAGARIVHANTAGAALLAAGDVLSAAGGRLMAADAVANQELRGVFVAADNGDAALGVKGVAVPLVARDGERYVAHVLPLTSGARRRAGTSYKAAAAVFVHKAALDIPAPPEIIAKTYKLTPTELRVLLAVVEVGGAPEVAEALGIAETTVKFHLRKLFDKTGVRRQAELVKLVAGFVSPLV